jgi:hypothetical protein
MIMVQAALKAEMTEANGAAKGERRRLCPSQAAISSAIEVYDAFPARADCSLVRNRRH